jgi:hypothetical protein
MLSRLKHATGSLFRAVEHPKLAALILEKLPPQRR